MKNIEGISKGRCYNLHSKFKFLIEKTNSLLKENLEDVSIVDRIKRNFNKLIRFSEYFIYKIETEKDFEEFLVGFEKILKELEIEKLYNNTTIKDIHNFDKLNLFQQFFYISIPIYNLGKIPSFIKGGICYNWAIFFYNLFNYIDRNQKLDKKLILYSPKYSHGAFMVGFKNRKFIIDPYAKKNGLVTEIKMGNNVYLGARFSNLIFGEIIDDKDLKIKAEGKYFEPQVYESKDDFIKNINMNSFLDIKIYIDGAPVQLSLKEKGEDSILIFFNGKIFERNLSIVRDDIISVLIEKSFGNNLDKKYKILLAILGFYDEFLNETIKKQLKVISDKIDENYLYEIFGIDKYVKVFNQTEKF